MKGSKIERRDWFGEAGTGTSKNIFFMMFSFLFIYFHFKCCLH